MQEARVQYYVDRFIPEELRSRFYDVLEDYAHAHDLLAIKEMRRAVRRNGFASANDVKAEEGDTAAAITLSVIARYPSLKGESLRRKIEEERERVLGKDHRSINPSTIHRHKRGAGRDKRGRR